MIFELDREANAFALVASNEIGQQLAREWRRHVAEGVTEIQVDVVNLDLGQPKLEDALGADEGRVGSTGGEGHLVRPSALRKCGGFDNEASRRLNHVGNNYVRRARNARSDVSAARRW